jgi:hypothetical protein
VFVVKANHERADGGSFFAANSYLRNFTQDAKPEYDAQAY